MRLKAGKGDRVCSLPHRHGSEEGRLLNITLPSHKGCALQKARPEGVTLVCATTAVGANVPKIVGSQAVPSEPKAGRQVALVLSTNV